ncbi:hypothetical protein [Paenibacillus humicus]|uniref:hypothetical protein n=1 Tax=Paenibacillus humicus TaxID=412861 RepID=UPI000FD739C2|nr:hypothetical protein [Paenibacillus humicus]
MFVKYVEVYKQEGIEIWALSVQNEAKAVRKAASISAPGIRESVTAMTFSAT